MHLESTTGFSENRFWFVFINYILAFKKDLMVLRKNKTKLSFKMHPTGTTCVNDLPSSQYEKRIQSFTQFGITQKAWSYS